MEREDVNWDDLSPEVRGALDGLFTTMETARGRSTCDCGTCDAEIVELQNEVLTLQFVIGLALTFIDESGLSAEKTLPIVTTTLRLAQEILIERKP